MEVETSLAAMATSSAAVVTSFGDFIGVFVSGGGDVVMSSNAPTSLPIAVETGKSKANKTGILKTGVLKKLLESIREISKPTKTGKTRIVASTRLECRKHSTRIEHPKKRN